MARGLRLRPDVAAVVGFAGGGHPCLEPQPCPGRCYCSGDRACIFPGSSEKVTCGVAAPAFFARREARQACRSALVSGVRSHTIFCPPRMPRRGLNAQRPPPVCKTRSGSMRAWVPPLGPRRQALASCAETRTALFYARAFRIAPQSRLPRLGRKPGAGRSSAKRVSCLVAGAQDEKRFSALA